MPIFGHDVAIPLFHYKYLPSSDSLSFMDVVQERKHGVIVSKDASSAMRLFQLKTRYKEKIRFDLVSKCKTDQGDISIIKWDLLKKE
jgi:hypothetical protein